MAATVAACNASRQDAPNRNVKLTISSTAASGGGTDLGPGQIAGMLSREGLTSVGADGRAIARLGESWKWDPDGKQLHMKLRSGVVFHDGTPFTSDLAAELIRTALANPNNRVQYPALSDVVSVRPDGSELVFQLSQPSALLPEDLTILLGKNPGNVGTGPYRLVERNDQHLLFERFDGYYLGEPEIARVEVRLGETLRTAWASLLRSEVDMVMEVPPDAIQFIRNDEISAFSFPRSYQYLIAFNSARPVFKSPVVRRAINLAVDRQTLIQDVLGGSGAPSTGPLWFKHWAYDASIQPYAFDVTTAISLLEAAGFRANAAPASATAPPARLRFTCIVPVGYPILERLGLEVQKQLYGVGVDLQFDLVPFAEYDARIRQGNFDAAIIDMISGPTFERPYLFWRSAKQSSEASLFGAFGYENPQAETLFQVLRTSTNAAAIRSATHRLQQVFLDDPPALFLAWNERTRAVRRNFRVMQEPDRDPMLTLWRWVADNPARTISTQ